jgi:curved DNA-binding protein CbpA
MQQIVEAYLILNDSEARKRYDLSYERYMFEKQRFQQKNKTKNQERKTNENFKKSSDTRNSKSNQFFFDIEDDVLRKWMRNAKNQAKDNLTNIIQEFADSSSVGFSSLWGNLIIAVISFVVLKFIAVAIMQLFN